LGAAAYLFYYRYPPSAWLLAVFVSIILLSIATLGRALLISEPDIPENIAQFLEVQRPNNTASLFDYSNDYFYEDNIIEQNEEQVLLFSTYLEPRTQVEFRFPPIETLNGEWAFEGGSIRAQGALNGTFEANRDVNWISLDEVVFSTDSDANIRRAEPYMIVNLPITTIHQGREFGMQADLSIAYPAESGEIQHTTLSREVDVLVISDNFYQYSYQYNEYRRAHRVLDTPLWAVLVVGSVFAGGGSFALIRRGALERGLSSGGFVLQVQRAKGSKLLGAEAHRLPYDATTQIGVFIGWVNAQSPAGRAGLQSGDILVSLNEQPIKSPGNVDRVARRFKKGDVVPAVIIRENEQREITIRF
jgi:hypothetical protein